MIKILFTYPIEVSNEGERLEELMKDYDYLHIRKPDYSQEKMEELLNALSPELRSRSIIHSHYYLATRYELAGINLNRRVMDHVFDIDDTGSCEIQTLIKSEEKILVNRQLVDLVTFSSHSLDEIESLEIDTDYVFLSPIFDSISKQDYPSNFKDLKIVGEKLDDLSQKVVALGGIKGEHADVLSKAGFSGYGVLGSVWQNELIDD